MSIKLFLIRYRIPGNGRSAPLGYAITEVQHVPTELEEQLVARHGVASPELAEKLFEFLRGQGTPEAWSLFAGGGARVDARNGRYEGVEQMEPEFAKFGVSSRDVIAMTVGEEKGYFGSSRGDNVLWVFYPARGELHRSKGTCNLECVWDEEGQAVFFLLWDISHDLPAQVVVWRYGKGEVERSLLEQPGDSDWK